MKKILSVLLVVLTIATLSIQAQTQKVSLDGSWNLTYGLCDDSSPKVPDELAASGWPTIAATVPGNVELDLISSGKLNVDWEKGDGIYKFREFEPYQWWFHRTFATPDYKKGERVELYFEGIDCYGTIWINNQIVGETDNMLRPYRFDVTDALNASGNNDIYIRINPAILECRKIFNSAVGKRRYMRHEQEYIRKAPHMYGWDIMPRVLSAGMWRSVSLEVKKANQFDNVFWMTDKIDKEKKTADLLLDWQITTDYLNIDGLSIEIEISKAGKKVFSRKEAIFSFCGRQRLTLENVEYWWPRGYGEPVLYDTKIRLIEDKTSKVLDEKEVALGVRTVVLDRSEVSTRENPGKFQFIVNGVPVFVRGINWSPTSAFHSQDLKYLPKTFEHVLDLNCNLVRLWGGSVYGSDEFYRLCNENGVMVWQDFSMACTAYPQDANFAQKVREEAIQTIIRIRNNPSLVMYCGNNENDISIEANFKKSMDPNYDVISRDILRRAIWEYDPIRDYIPSSPYMSPEGYKLDPNGSMPMTHLWGERGWYKTPYYADNLAAFVAEIGYHGCPCRSSLEKTVDAEFLYPWKEDGSWNDQWQIHSVRPHPEFHGADGRNDWMVSQPRFLFGEDQKDLDKFIAQSQYTQGEAMKFFVETYRMGRPIKSGIVLWNLREGWPTFSEALIDYFYQKKISYHYINRVYENTCVMIGEPKNGMHPVVVDNQTQEPKSGKVTIKDAENDQVIYQAAFKVPANGNMTIGYLPDQEKQTMWIIDYTVENEKQMNHYLVGQPPFKLADYDRWFKKLNIQRDL